MRAHRPSARRNRADWSKPGLISRLGNEPDQNIATELGVTRERVRQVRKQLGIDSNRERNAGIDPLPPELRARLGTAKDSVLATEFGISSQIVRNERRKAGIAPYRQPCGTVTKYGHGCRCVLCKRANADRMYDYYKRNPDAQNRAKEKQLKKMHESAPHTKGKITWYAMGCRCDACKYVGLTHVSTPRKTRPAEMPVSAYGKPDDTDYVFPRRLVVDEETFAELERRTENPRPPNEAIRDLFKKVG